MEALSCKIYKAIEEGEFKGLTLAKDGPVVSHLFYADDALIWGEWSRLNVANMVRILRCFHACSGLKANIHKSNLFGLGTSGNELGEMASMMGFKSGLSPFEYLGILVGANMNKISNWCKIVDVFEARLALWKVVGFMIDDVDTLTHPGKPRS
ncbi:uncharacterized protein LOC143558270 [Bidens hawaiensis]|uniref:uncharacterized protein LOC143558270 n=1 Tax=Bidens hawaiensis TaxID=980011 RepID=UPI0040491C28